MVLSDNVGEALGTIFAGEYLVGHLRIRLYRLWGGAEGRAVFVLPPNYSLLEIRLRDTLGGMEFRAVLLPAVLTAACACAQTADRPIAPNGPAKAPNGMATYVALRADLPGADSATVKDFTLTREGGTFHFTDGSFYFYAPVDGKVTGAVFTGKGQFDLTVKDAGEQQSLAVLTKSDSMAQDFTTLVLRFTDGTAEEIRKASAGPAGARRPRARGGRGPSQGLSQELSDNVELRMLADIWAAARDSSSWRTSAWGVC